MSGAMADALRDAGVSADMSPQVESLVDVDALNAALVSALASDAKRVSHAAVKDAPAIVAARALADASEAVTAVTGDERNELRARLESERLSLGKKRAQIVRKLGALDRKLSAPGTNVGSVAASKVKLSRELDSIKDRQAELWAEPIIAADIAPNGRFVAAVRYHSRTVGMLVADAEDVVMTAVELCYLRDGDTVGDVLTRRVMPTLGAMYRNVRRAHARLIDESRRNVRQGLVATYSLDELHARGVDVSERFERWGFDYAPSASGPDADAWNVATLSVPDVDASRQARADAARRAERAGARAAADVRERVSAAQSVGGVDGALLALLAAGQPIEALAAQIGSTPGTLTKRLSKLSPAGTRHSRTGSGVIGVSGQRATTDDDRARREALAMADKHARKGWTTVTGTLASPVKLAMVDA